jgi:hypothetical protein
VPLASSTSRSNGLTWSSADSEPIGCGLACPEPRLTIKVRSADLTYHALLVVIASDHVAARVELRTLMEKTLEPADRKLMRDGFKTKQDAAHYISTELMARAA